MAIAMTWDDVVEWDGVVTEVGTARWGDAVERRVEQGGLARPRAGARARARIRRRRLAAVVVVVAALTALALPLAGHGRQDPGAAASTAAAAADDALPTVTRAGQGTYYVVRPGDTLWSIARRIDPGHPRAVEQRLARVVGATAVVPGEHLRLS